MSQPKTDMARVNASLAEAQRIIHEALIRAVGEELASTRRASGLKRSLVPLVAKGLRASDDYPEL